MCFHHIKKRIFEAILLSLTTQLILVMQVSAQVKPNNYKAISQYLKKLNMQNIKARNEGSFNLNKAQSLINAETTEWYDFKMDSLYEIGVLFIDTDSIHHFERYISVNDALVLVKIDLNDVHQMGDIKKRSALDCSASYYFTNGKMVYKEEKNFLSNCKTLLDEEELLSIYKTRKEVFDTYEDQHRCYR